MISILMATYNGEQFLREQLDSLLCQTQLPTKIYISDDKSTDGTWEIIQEYEESYPDILVASQRTENSGSAKYNFMDLMIAVKDEYVMLCDQDDVWLPEKIELTLKKMKTMEEQYGKETPLLVHTDLKVVDENLNVIEPSYFEMARVETITSLKQMCLQNDVAGCTSLYNRSLAERLRPIQGYFVMHDWWLGLVCCAFGESRILPESTVLYRQHGNNEIGAAKASGLKHKIYKLFHTKEIKRAMQQSYAQAGSFLRTYKEELREEEREVLTAYEKLQKQNWILRMNTMRKYNLFRKGFFRKLSQFIFG